MKTFLVETNLNCDHTYLRSLAAGEPKVVHADVEIVCWEYRTEYADRFRLVCQVLDGVKWVGETEEED